MSWSCQNQHWGRSFAARSGKLVASVGRSQNQHWGRSFAATSGKLVALVGRFQIDNAHGRAMSHHLKLVGACHCKKLEFCSCCSRANISQVLEHLHSYSTNLLLSSGFGGTMSILHRCESIHSLSVCIVHFKRQRFV